MPTPTPERLAEIGAALRASVIAYEADNSGGTRLPLAVNTDPWAGTLSWGVGVKKTGSGRSWGYDKCVICKLPAITISPDGKPCHKGCAEQWTREHPAAVNDGPATL